MNQDHGCIALATSGDGLLTETWSALAAQMIRSRFAALELNWEKLKKF